VKLSGEFVRFVAVRALMALLLFLTFAAWSFASAVGGSPDEDYVLTSIWCGTEGNPPHCRKDPNRPNAMILPIMAAEPSLCLRQLGQDYSAACQQEIYGQEISTDLFNQGLYPNTYLDTLRVFVGSDVEASVVKMRIFNSFLAAVLITVAVSLDWRRSADSFIAWLVVAAPVTIYFIASLNASSWTLIGTTCFTIATLTALKNRSTVKIWLPATVLALVSIWLTNASRSEGILTLAIIFVAIIAFEFKPTTIVFNVQTVVTALSSVVALALLYFRLADKIKSAIVFRDSVEEYSGEFAIGGTNLLINNILNLPRFFMGFFGRWGLGWFEIELSPTIWLSSLEATLIVFAYSLLRSSKSEKKLLLTLCIFLCSAVLYVHQKELVPVGIENQPRYFLPLFLGIVIIATYRKNQSFPKWLLRTVAILAIVANSFALRETIRRYTTGQDVLTSKSLNQPFEWWWKFGPQPETIWLVGTLTFIFLFILIGAEPKNRYSSKTHD